MVHPVQPKDKIDSYFRGCVEFFSHLAETRAAVAEKRILIRNQTGRGTYCCMNPKMMVATCTNRLRSLLTMYHVLKFLTKGLKFHCDFWKVSITITLLFFSEY